MVQSIQLKEAFIFLLSFPATTSAIRRLPSDFSDTSVFSNGTSASHRRSQSYPPRRVSVPRPASADDHLVTHLPLLEPGKLPTSHWAGLLPASGNGDKYFFYWLFAPDNGSGRDADFSDTSIPLVIWLNGGPACSSMDGLWLENGPFRLTQSNTSNSWTIEIDDHSWHKAPAFVVYIDQPVGTGISFTTSGKYPKNDLEVNVDFYYFLAEFLKLHGDKFLDRPTNTLNRPLYFSGESHAGHYIPSMMNYIQQQNAKSPQVKIPLAGAAIGNGWIDPPNQYSAHEAAYGKAIIGLAQKRALEQAEKECQAELAKGNYNVGKCFDLLDDVVANGEGKGSEYRLNQYDARKTERVGQARDFPKGHKDVEAYLGGSGRQPFAKNYLQVLEAIHSIPSHEAGQQYEECTDPPYLALKHQDGLGVTQDVVSLLDNGVRMLFFNGIEDLICNHVGNEIVVESLEWKFQRDYQLAARYGWKSPSTKRLAGYMKEYQNLMYLKVKDSGHMVPMDLPDVALDMIRTFMYQGKFEDYEQLLTAKEKSSRSDCPICPSDNHGQCPECPFCPADNRNADGALPPENWEKWAEKSPLVLVGVAVATTWLVTLFIYWICSRKRKATGAPVSTYDMEMTTGGGYTDQPDLENEEDEAVEFT